MNTVINTLITYQTRIHLMMMMSYEKFVIHRVAQKWHHYFVRLNFIKY